MLDIHFLGIVCEHHSNPYATSHNLINKKFYSNGISDSSLVKSWQKINGYHSLDLFYNHQKHSFWAILHSQKGDEFIPSHRDGFERIKVPLLESKAIKHKLINMEFPFSSQKSLIQFFRSQLRYPIVKKCADGYKIQINEAGLLGGGANVSRIDSPFEAFEEIKTENDSKGFIQVQKFLMDRYKVTAPSEGQKSKDEHLIDKLAERICRTLPSDQSTGIEKHLIEFVDAYEDEYFDETVLEVIGRSAEEGKPQLSDYITNFHSRNLCIELLRKRYFAKERAKGGIEQVISERILAKLLEEAKPLITILQKNAEVEVQGKIRKGFEDLLWMLEFKEKVQNQLRPLQKIKVNRIFKSIKGKLGLSTEDNQQILDELCVSEMRNKIFNESVKEGMEKDFIRGKSVESSQAPMSPTKKLESETKNEIIEVDTSKEVLEADGPNSSNHIFYLNKVRLNVLNELNLLEHEPGTLVELHNLLKLEVSNTINNNISIETKGNSRNSKGSRLEDIRSLLISIVRGYRENEANLESNELTSLLPLAFIQDSEIFKTFLECFLADLRSDILFDAKKVRMLSFILISAMRNHNFKDYLKVDDLLQCLKILKPKIEDLSITSENVNLQEAIDSLNDILFLMGSIGAKGVKEENLQMVQELTKYMKTHTLDKTYHSLTGKAKDPSLNFKREYALEAFKRIEGTDYKEWEDKCANLLKPGLIALNVGKGIFMSDLSSINEALLQIKDLLLVEDEKCKTWYDQVNKLRFLSQEPIERIIKELFEPKNGHSKKYSFFAAEFILGVLTQPQRKLREKKIATQALWCLTNGYDYRESKKLRCFVKSSNYEFDKDIQSFVKNSLLNIAQMSDIDFSLFIKKLVESFRLESTENNRIDLSSLLKQREKLNQQDDNPGKKFYVRILMEKKPKLYALARIQERSEKTLDKPSILVDFRGIDKEKDYDEAFMKLVNEKIESIKSKNVQDFLRGLGNLDPSTATKKKFLDFITKTISTQGGFKADEELLTKYDVEAMREAISTKVDHITEINTFDLLQVLEDFLNDPSKTVLLVQGDAGAGKTLLLRLFEQDLWKRYNMLSKADSKSRHRLPLRIALSEVRSFDKAVEELLVNNGCDFEAINDTRKEPAAILFDGYDEINQYINLFDLNKLETWRDVKVIFTSRKENLTSLKEDYILCFAPGKDKQKVLSYTIRPVNEDQIRKYFNAQVEENRHIIQKLEERLKELNGNNPITESISKTIENKIDCFNEFHDSERFEPLRRILNFLEEQFPQIELLQEEIKNLKGENDLEVSPLKETFETQILELKKVTNRAYTQHITTKMQSKAESVKEFEKAIAIIINDNPESTRTLDYFMVALRNLLKSSNLKRVCNQLGRTIENLQKIMSEIIERGTSPEEDLQPFLRMRDRLESSQKIMNPEYFKELAQKLSDDIKSMKDFEKQFKDAYPNDFKEDKQVIVTERAEWHVKTIQEFTNFENLKNIIQKTREHLVEYRNLRDQINRCIKLEDERTEAEIVQGSEDDNIKTLDIEKLKILISNIKQTITKVSQTGRELNVFGYSLFNSPFEFNDIFYQLRDKASKENIDYNKMGMMFDNFETTRDKFEIFRDETVSYWGARRESSINDIANIIFLEKAKITLGNLQENVKEVWKLMKKLRATKAQNNQESVIVQELQKQISILKYSDHSKFQNIIQKLDEIAQEVKTLENEFKALKDEHGDESTIKALQKQINDLKKFTDSDNLEAVIRKFKDIITSPFMLKMLLQTLLKYPKSSANRAELYRLFATIHFEREKEKLLQSEKIPPKFNVIDSFFQYSKDLAVNMFIRRITSLQAKSSGYKVLGIIETKKKDIWSRFFDDQNIITKLSKRGAQIVEDDGIVRFIHKSILEYFAARQFYDEIVGYNVEDLEPYDPCLNKGPIVDNETAVYLFLRDIAESEIAKNPQEMTVFDKKLLELMNSAVLQKIYGNDFDKNTFYPNLFLILLLRKNLVKKIVRLKEDSLTFILIRNIFKWVFSDSLISPKYAEMICKVYTSDPKTCKGMNYILSLYYHDSTKTKEGGPFKDKFITNKTNTHAKIKIKRNVKQSQNLIVKDGIVSETSNEESSWVLDGKLFIHDSQDNIVLIRDEVSGKYLGVDHKEWESNEKTEKRSSEFVVNELKLPWEVKDCKWVLRMNLYEKDQFTLYSIAEPSKILWGCFRDNEDYETFFKDMCSCDTHISSSNDERFNCDSCEIKGNKIVCKSCLEHCHKDHTTRQQGNGGFCDCRFMGFCGLLNGCSARFPAGYKDVVMYRCMQCSAEERKIICLGCKKHHERDHQNFEKVTDGDQCECDCIANRTKIIAQFQSNDDYADYLDEADSKNQNGEKEQDEEEDDNEDEEISAFDPNEHDNNSSFENIDILNEDDFNQRLSIEINDFEEFKNKTNEKIEEGRVKLQDKLSTQYLKNIKEKQNLIDYYNGFTKTIEDVYLTSRLIETKQLVLDSNNAGVGVLSILLAFISIEKSESLRDDVNNLEELLKTYEIINFAKKMNATASDAQILGRVVSECGLAIIDDPEKQTKITTTNKRYGSIPFSFEGKLNGRLEEKLKNELSTVTNLYRDIFKTPAAKQGNSDANKLIQIWINDNIRFERIPESPEAQEKTNRKYINEIIQKDNPDSLGNSDSHSCMFSYNNSNCQLF